MGGPRLPPPLAMLFLGLASAVPDWWAAAVGVAPPGEAGLIWGDVPHSLPFLGVDLVMPYRYHRLK